MEAYLLWYMFAGLLLVLEAFSPGMFLFVCFALGALLAGLSQQLAIMSAATLSLQSQLGVFLAATVMALLFIKPILKTIIKIPNSAAGLYPNNLIGKEALVFKAISHSEMGAVRPIDTDETWLAKSVNGVDIAQGTMVTIKSIEANHLLVSSLK